MNKNQGEYEPAGTDFVNRKPESIRLESSCKRKSDFGEECEISASSEQYLCNSQKARMAGRKNNPP